MVSYIPSRGDLVWLDFDPQGGREIKKTRPALVISLYKYNLKSGLALFMPITSQVKGYPFEELVHLDDVHGAILCDQVRSLDWKFRNARYIDKLDPKILNKALEKFRLLIA